MTETLADAYLAALAMMQVTGPDDAARRGQLRRQGNRSSGSMIPRSALTSARSGPMIRSRWICA